MVIVLIGAFRFWRQQNAMAREKYHVGGWETISVGLITLAVSVAASGSRGQIAKEWNLDHYHDFRPSHDSR